jgi:hypothetical protein
VQEFTDLQRLAAVSRDAFTAAREVAIQRVFDRIAGTVLRYYSRLHEAPPPEPVECTDLKMVPTERAARGGLRLAVQFLGRATSDARVYLSEGHLDSLGLCIYLACVRLFNPPGCLLVLDDVLTSVDRDHKRRVCDLLLEEFTDYQLVVTTHDEVWFQQFNDSLVARGETHGWRLLRIANWRLETGPETAAFELTWAFIQEHLKEPDFRNLGGPLRCVFEDFLKRVAEKIKLEIVYRQDNLHTAADFTNKGLHGAITAALLKADVVCAASLQHTMSLVFGNSGLINALSHHGDRRLEVPLPEVVDFVAGLKTLSDLCAKAKIIKGVVQ